MITSIKTMRLSAGVAMIIDTLKVFILGFSISWVFTLTCYALLGVSGLAMPWDFINVLPHASYSYIIASASITTVLYLLVFAYIKGGHYTIFSLYSLKVLLFIGLGVFFGILLFSYWFSLEIESVAEALYVVGTLDSDDTKYLFVSLFAGLFIPSLIFYPFIRDRFSKESNALGNAHFAGGIEVIRKEFLKKDDGAIIIGKKYNAPLYSNGHEHVLVFAPTGSGKTRSIAIPNLFQYPYSIVCNDVKLSLFETTSRYREEVLGHKCYCFAPTSKKTHRFNPLDCISRDPIFRMQDIQKVAHILMPNPKGEAIIWAQASRKLFKALVLYLMDCEEETLSLGEINRMVKKADFDGWLSEKLESTTHFSPEFYRNGYSYINNHEKTRASILESFTGYFELFDDPIIDAATAATDFDILSLRSKKTTIYIGFSDDEMERLSPLLTLLWQQLISGLIKEIPDKEKEPYPVLCLIDEFSSLGRIERLRRSLKLLREYRVRCILMFQYIAQTYEQYSKDEAKAFTNIKTKIAYSTEDSSDAEYISKLLGTKTQRVRAGSLSYQENGTNNSKSYNYQAIPLMRPEQIMKMSTNAALIVRTGCSPIKAGQYIWYKEKDMKHLKFEPVPVPTQEPVIHAFDHKISEKKQKKSKVVSDEMEAYV